MIGEKMEGTIAHVVDETLTPPAKESGSQLAALVKLICTPINMLEVYHDAWIKDFERRVTEKFKKIPDAQRQAPPLNIVGPALEASKYHLGVEEMREMFANLVSHACNQKMSSAIHPAFVTILTQLSPLEAHILAEFRPKQEVNLFKSISVGGQEIPMRGGSGVFAFPEQILPIANYYLVNGSRQFLAQSNVMKIDLEAEIETISSAVTNLIRLGLVDAQFTMSLSDQKSYEWFYDNKLYDTLCRDINPDGHVSMRTVRGNPIWGGNYKEIRIEKGLVRLTPLGYDFIKVCVLEEEVITCTEP